MHHFITKIQHIVTMVDLSLKNRLKQTNPVSFNINAVILFLPHPQMEGKDKEGKKKERKMDYCVFL